uniref:Variant surface glycoprotein n=1 Tax=Trypanosoma brucei TaxID=5691 RepID=A0A1V0G083_9TRYP|nr:variant surface glycoprotein [Trypanosoma brucei]
MPNEMAITLMLALVALETDVRGAANDNINHFATLCELVKLAQTTPPTPAAPTAAQNDVDEILKLNLTAADEAWRSRFTGTEEQLEWTQVAKKIADEKTKADWKPKWARWLQTHKAANDGSPGSRWIDKSKPLAPGYGQQLAKTQLTQIADAATGLEATLAGLVQTQRDTDIAAATTALNKALCGNGINEPGDGSLCHKGGAEAFSKTTSCTGNKAGLSLATDLACLCLDTTGASCIGKLDNSKVAVAALAAGAMKATLEACPSGRKIDYADLPAAIESALARTAALLTLEHNNNKVTLGKTDDGTCATAATFCVAYDTYYTGNKAGFETIPWVIQLRSAQKAILAYQQKEQSKAMLADRIAALKTAAATAYEVGKLNLPDTGKAGSTDKPTADTTTKSETKCPKQNKTVEECPSDRCDYDKEKGCSIKPGQENTATGTGEATGGAATTGCARHKDKNACDADKKDDKQNCAWRKGKEGETDEPDKEKCRNGSFLVDKQFALSVVSAAFVALLF